MDNRRGFIGFIGLLLTLVILSILCYYAFTAYFKRPLGDTATEQAVSEQGINTSNYQSILNSTKMKIKDIEQQAAAREY